MRPVEHSARIPEKPALLQVAYASVVDKDHGSFLSNLACPELRGSPGYGISLSLRHRDPEGLLKVWTVWTQLPRHTLISWRALQPQLS
jgi:hypothetical protein